MKRNYHVVLGFGLFVAACSDGSAPPGPPAVSLNLNAASASPSPLSAAALGARQSAIRAYFQARTASLNPAATTHTSRGTIIDWVRPGALAAPPPPMKPCTQMCAKTDLQDEPAARGPAGTVPVVRFDVDAYLAATAMLPADPAQVLPRKQPPPAPESTGFYYADWRHDSGTFYGGGAGINTWQSVPGIVTRSTSVAEVNLYSGSTSNGLGNGVGQSVEVGQTENAGVNGGSTAPHLFTWFTTNDWGPTGNNVGGYNAQVTGWHQVSSDITPGVALATSTTGGTQYEIEIEIMRYAGNYWVWFNTEWIGYYPTSLFAASGIANSAPNLEFYGEVGDPNAPKAVATGMGSGAFASGGLAHAAFIRDMHRFVDSNGAFSFFQTSDGSPHVTDSNCYTMSAILTDGSNPGNLGTVSPPALYQTWYNYFYYGGPGLGGACQ